MPQIRVKSIYTIQSREQGETLLESRGFGEREAEVKMMNLMMVEGSGYEGMDMDAMGTTGAPPKANGHSELTLVFTKMPNAPIVGANRYEFTVADPKTQKPLANLKPSAQVYMTSMDMGTDAPRVKEMKPGYYEVKAIYSMKGPWALKITTPQGEKILPVEVGATP